MGLVLARLLLISLKNGPLYSFRGVHFTCFVSAWRGGGGPRRLCCRARVPSQAQELPSGIFSGCWEHLLGRTRGKLQATCPRGFTRNSLDSDPQPLIRAGGGESPAHLDSQYSSAQYITEGGVWSLPGQGSEQELRMEGGLLRLGAWERAGLSAPSSRKPSHRKKEKEERFGSIAFRGRTSGWMCLLVEL